MILETKRLWLRELCEDDDNDLCKILQDEEVMTAYAHAFCDEEVNDWLQKQLHRYRQDGYGLWAVIIKGKKELIGQCGLTNQVVDDKTVLEIGYLFQKAYWKQGFAIEAASACRDYAFQKYPIDAVYSIIRDTNMASKKVAERNGMTCIKQIVKHYYGMEMTHDVYRILRSENKPLD